MSNSVKYNDWELACKTYGSEMDDVLILIHGASSDQRIWKYLIELAKDQYFVITLDLLGHGASEKPQTDYNLQVWSENILSVLNHFEINQAHLIAHSFGVLVAKQFYHSNSDRVKTITLVDGNLRQTLGDAIYNWMKTTMERPDYEEYMKSLNEKKQPFCLKKKDSELVSEGVLNTPKYVLKGQLESMRNGTDLEVKLEVPTLAAYAQSHEWNDEAEKYLRDFTEKLELHVWDDVSHFIMLEQPDRLWNTISNYITNQK